MKKALILISALAVALLAGCGGGGGGGGDVQKPEITNVTYSATQFYGAGTLRVSANATDNVGVTSVEVVLSGPTTLTQPMNLTSGSTYSGQVSIPENTTSSDITYTVRVRVKDAAGNTSQSDAVNIKVISTDTPPPPPV